MAAVFTSDDVRKLTEFGAARVDEREAVFAALKRMKALIDEAADAGTLPDVKELFAIARSVEG